MLSLTCKTAIKAVIYLSSRTDPEDRPGIREIATAINANEHTVGKLLQTLVKQNVINSIKGPSGGFYISSEQQKLPIITVIEAIDGTALFTACGLGLSKCSSTHPCPIHNDYQEGKKLLEKLFRTKRIIDLCGAVSSGAAYLIG
ncbi:MAG: transcriptional regulator [Sphingobacteriales bacterium 50-39]|nr:Rrf2 family transcriptional regulator [Sphingobacteriales bacterium]OJW56297.1 MAG: transcriptional regulator [Sphingobacteriales bacterium 50-39]